MSAKGKGFLLVLMDCPTYLEDEFNAWYDTEHIPERLAIPGFETGLRFVCLEGHPRYLAMYDLERPEVLEFDGLPEGRPRQGEPLDQACHEPRARVAVGGATGISGDPSHVAPRA